MLNPRALFLLLLVLACGETSPQQVGDAGSPCGQCLAGQTCDTASKTCVKALPEGALCAPVPGADAGTDGGIDGQCEEGRVCAAVGEVMRCSRDCTSRTVGEVCGADERCFSRPGSSTAGFCARTAGAGLPCDSASLTFCSGGTLSCITPNPAATAGQCFTRCAPGTSGECPTGQVCADPFADPSSGVCVTHPGYYPSKCDHSQLQFCGGGEACVRPGKDSFGYCHKRCSTTVDCPMGQACLEPEAGIKICSVPVGTNLHCAAGEDLYCGVTDLCVKVGSDTVCKVDCSTQGDAACSTGTRCSKLEGSERKACL